LKILEVLVCIMLLFTGGKASSPIRLGVIGWAAELK
jgi:hypothetical protein